MRKRIERATIRKVMSVDRRDRLQGYDDERNAWLRVFRVSNRVRWCICDGFWNC